MKRVGWVAAGLLLASATGCGHGGGSGGATVSVDAAHEQAGLKAGYAVLNAAVAADSFADFGPDQARQAAPGSQVSFLRQGSRVLVTVETSGYPMCVRLGPGSDFDTERARPCR